MKPILHFIAAFLLMITSVTGEPVDGRWILANTDASITFENGYVSGLIFPSQCPYSKGTINTPIGEFKYKTEDSHLIIDAISSGTRIKSFIFVRDTSLTQRDLVSLEEGDAIAAIMKSLTQNHRYLVWRNLSELRGYMRQYLTQFGSPATYDDLLQVGLLRKDFHSYLGESYRDLKLTEEGATSWVITFEDGSQMIYTLSKEAY